MASGPPTSGPAKTAEAIVAVLVPPACREEVLGDLHERYRSPIQYGMDALRTVPMVIVSRIRRTTDPQVLLMQAFALYVSYLGAAWFKDSGLLNEPWGLVRLAVPSGVALLGMMLQDAYSKPGITPMRGPLVGVGLALASQIVFRIARPDLALPALIALQGCAMGYMLTFSVRMLFPPPGDQLKGAHVPADWLKRSGVTHGDSATGVRVVAVIVLVVIAGSWMADAAALPQSRVVVNLLLVLAIAYQVWKRV